ncbi:hypothetical protein QTP70_016047 [Hemibagrus guttatus]|uniref:Uncharacterized protein n=1 Tax=Hemibagrus guttatus TaxID=175788 RepID=A0AAE0Q3T4_9TELE|nr:hypothetical protein QTP70_016047 [Hemibagrus guttatus]
MLNSYAAPRKSASNFLEGQVAFSHARWSNNRSVMPLDARGLHVRHNGRISVCLPFAESPSPFCTHRPSLLPIGWFSEVLRSAPLGLLAGLGGAPRSRSNLTI